MPNESKFVAGVNDELWRLPKVKEKVGDVSNATWWDWVRRGVAPQGIKLSHRITVWRASEIQAFVEKLATSGLE